MNITPSVIEVQSVQADAIISIEELIKRHAESIEKLKHELKQKREMFSDGFDNNPAYRDACEKVKDVTKAKSAIKAQIAKQPSVAKLNQEIKDLRFDLNEQQKTLSDLLIDYHEQTGATQLELFSGQIMSIVTSAKLVRGM